MILCVHRRATQSKVEYWIASFAAGHHGEINRTQTQALLGRYLAQLAQRIADAGFTEVEVTGDGRERKAKALWPLDDATAEIPSQISKIVEIA